MSYVDEVKTEKKYRGNVVILFGEQYFAIRPPDSGLNIQSPHNRSVMALNLNPSTLDIRKVNTTIASYSFRILDKDDLLTSIMSGDGSDLIGQEVRIWLGRSDDGMDFSQYFELPKTQISKIDHSDNSYVISSQEPTERMTKAIFDFSSAIAVNILAATTVFTMREDISDFPSTGFLKIDNEFVSYAGKDLANNRFTGVIRGELNSVPADHDANTECVLVQTLTDNPLNIILKILISGGGGGTYDTLQDGLGISEDEVDIAEIEDLRDTLFLGESFTLSIYNVDSALKYIEKELLMPTGLRFTQSINSKITLAILDKAKFVPESDVIDEDTITKFPKWAIDGAKVTNVIEVKWDYVEGSNVFRERDIYENADSIATYGRQTALKYEFKGVKATLDGQNLMDDFGARLLSRLSTPTPEISITTQLDKSLQNIGDKAYLISSKIPAPDGTLNFASDVEITSRAINPIAGDCKFTLAYTSFTKFRSGFIAPSDLILSFATQKKVTIGVDRADFYRVGWYMRLWDEQNQVYCADAPNKIVSIIEDSSYLLTESGEQLTDESGNAFITEQEGTEGMIVFENDWDTTLENGRYRMRFADYDDTIDSQKRYCFISDDGNNFLSDNKPTYKVTY